MSGCAVSILQGIVLGLTQGASESAPISSSGHLILVPWFLGWPLLADTDLNKTFDVALHMGTLLGALVYFRRDVATYLRAWSISLVHRRIASEDERIAWALVIGTIPGVIVGATLEGVIQGSLEAPWLIAVTLALFSVVLWWIDRRMPMTRGFGSIGPRNGLFLGVAQALALQPAVSGFQGYFGQFFWGFAASALSGFVVIWTCSRTFVVMASASSCGFA